MVLLFSLAASVTRGTAIRVQVTGRLELQTCGQEVVEPGKVTEPGKSLAAHWAGRKAVGAGGSRERLRAQREGRQARMLPIRGA